MPLKSPTYPDGPTAKIYPTGPCTFKYNYTGSSHELAPFRHAKLVVGGLGSERDKGTFSLLSALSSALLAALLYAPLLLWGHWLW